MIEAATTLEAIREYVADVRRYTQGESDRRLAGNMQPARLLGQHIDAFVDKTTMEGCIDMLAIDDSPDEVLRKECMPNRDCLAIDALLVVEKRIKDGIKKWYNDGRNKYQSENIFQNVHPVKYMAGKTSGMGDPWSPCYEHGVSDIKRQG